MNYNTSRIISSILQQSIGPYYSLNLLNEYKEDEIFINKDRIRLLGKSLQEVCNGYRVYLKVYEVKATNIAIHYSVELNDGTSIRSLYSIKTELEVHLGHQIEISEDSSRIIIALKNDNRSFIGLKNVMKTKAFINSMSPLTIAAGIDMGGKPVIIDLVNAPHILISGTTGSGKSIFLDDLLLSILYKASPADVRMSLIDPKHVELHPYDGIPHLLNPVIHRTIDALDSFMWLEDEILRRYNKLFTRYNVRSIEEYNNRANKRLPRILLVIDEYADLIRESPKEIHEIIDRIARLGRAVGVHLILVTQLPISKIVTPQIKANIPCRLSFTVLDKRESRIILDKTGAERLLGNGDMIFSDSGQSSGIHAQAAYVSETELEKVLKHIKKQKYKNNGSLEDYWN